MMASMAVGNDVGQNIVGSMNTIMNQNHSVSQNNVDPYQELTKLKSLLDQGIITEEEFNKKKKELLGL